MTARSALRTATAGDHDRVDQIFARFALSEPAGYRSFLRATATAHLPVERALDAAGAERLLPDWPARRRAHLLHEDLRALGTEPPPMAPEPRWAGEAALLGAIYVLEGSRLGGAMLRRALAPDAPQSFLGAPGAAGAWRRLSHFLDRSLADRQKLDEAILVARQVFASFAAAGCAELEPVN